jgi:hypothetical protein
MRSFISKKFIAAVIFLLPVIVMAADVQSFYAEPVAERPEWTSAADAAIKTAHSPKNRVAVLELYTSEGCSSCPPADRFLSALKDAGISDRQLIPMAFHVTYWDHIGWRDRFAKKQYDQRQRSLARKNRQNSVYTPQFVLVGDDYRSYASFSEDINKLAVQIATVDLMLRLRFQDSPGDGSRLHGNIMTGSEDVAANVRKIYLELTSTAVSGSVDDISLYFAVLEDHLYSDVNDGENDGEKLRHDYVVRHLSEPYLFNRTSDPARTEYSIELPAGWKRQDLSVIAFAENSQTGEVLQAVRIKL